MAFELGDEEGEVIFEELGYSISFFSSMDNQNSCSFLMTAGNRFEKINNALIVDLPLSFDLYDKKLADMIRNLFEKLVHTYRPFWGCVSNKALSQKYGKFLEGNLPTTVHWMNYWSEDIINTIGIKKIQKIVDENPRISFQDGILTINDVALDVDKEDNMRFHDELQKQLLIQE